MLHNAKTEKFHKPRSPAAASPPRDVGSPVQDRKAAPIPCFRRKIWRDELLSIGRGDISCIEELTEKTGFPDTWL